MKFAELWAYEKLFWRRVYDDTWNSIIEHLVMEGLITTVAFIFGFLGQDQNALGGFVAAAAALGTITFGMIVKNLITVGPKLYDEQRLTVKNLTDEKNALIEDAKPRLEFFFEPGKEPFEHTEPALATGPAVRLFRIGIRNKGTTRLTDCSAKLCEMSNTTNVFLPIALKRRDDNPPPRPGSFASSGKPIPPFISHALNSSDDYKQTFSLNPQDVEFFDVVRLDETNDAAELEFVYARSPRIIPRTVPRGYYGLTVKAFANVGGEVVANFAVSVNDSGQLQFYRLWG